MKPFQRPHWFFHRLEESAILTVYQPDKIGGFVVGIALGALCLLVGLLGLIDPEQRPPVFHLIPSNVVLVAVSVLGILCSVGGAYCLIGYSEVVIDRKRSTIRTAIRFFRVWPLRVRPLGAYSDVVIEFEGRPQSRPHPFQYHVRLVGDEKRLRLVTCPKYDDALELAVAVAEFSGLRLNVLGIAPQQAGTEPTPQIRSGSGEEDLPASKLPEPPDGCRVRIEQDGGTVRVVLPSPGWRVRQSALITIAVLVVIGVPVFVLPPVLEIAQDTNSTNQWILISYAAGPFVAIVAYCVFAALDESSHGERILLQDKRVILERSSRFRRWRLAVPFDELENIQVTCPTIIGLTRSAKQAELYSLVVYATRGCTNFGKFLRQCEAEYIISVMQSWAATLVEPCDSIDPGPASLFDNRRSAMDN